MYFLESPSVTGPFRLITYLQRFGPEAYFVNIPSRYLGTTAEPDLTARLSYSANFAFRDGPPNPPGSGYFWSLLASRFSLL